MVRDIQDIQEKFPVEKKTIILVDQGNMVTGMIIDGVEKIFTEQETNTYNSAYQNNDLDQILGDSYKILIVDSSIVDSMKSETVQFDVYTFTKQEIINIPGDITYSSLNKNRIEFLNLVDINDFLRDLKES